MSTKKPGNESTTTPESNEKQLSTVWTWPGILVYFAVGVPLRAFMPRHWDSIVAEAVATGALILWWALAFGRRAPSVAASLGPGLDGRAAAARFDGPERAGPARPHNAPHQRRGLSNRHSRVSSLRVWVPMRLTAWCPPRRLAIRSPVWKNTGPQRTRREQCQRQAKRRAIHDAQATASDHDQVDA